MGRGVIALALTAAATGMVVADDTRETRLYVRTIPPGAKVVVDGREMGVSDSLHIILPGDHRVTLEMEGYEAEEHHVTVPAKRITRLVVTLTGKGTASQTSHGMPEGDRVKKPSRPPPGPPEWSDDFTDGVIDERRWVVTGRKGGVGGFGKGDWKYSFSERGDRPGYLEARVQGPRSGNTYWGEASIRTAFDFNDGHSWLINFSWDTVVGGEPHFDCFGIQITDGGFPKEDNCYWVWNQNPEGTGTLWYTGTRTPMMRHLPHPPFSRQAWSIAMDPDGTARLHLAPDARGPAHSELDLDRSKKWFVRFIVLDAASAGFDGGDNAFRLYEFNARRVTKSEDTAGKVGKERTSQATGEGHGARVPSGDGTRLPGAPAVPSPAQRDASRRAGVEPAIEVDLGGGVTMKMVLIPAGTFMMGSPVGEEGRRTDEAQHEVKISKSFYMGSREVTRDQFAAFVKDNGYKTVAEREGWSGAWDGRRWGRVNGASWRRPGFEQTDDHPTVCLTWSDAAAFCEWLSGKARRAICLPTEAEWEYACRAGTTTAYQWGNNPVDGGGWCNVGDLTQKDKMGPFLTVFNWRDGFVFTAPVASFEPNAWGLYDMLGNAAEWCADWYGEYPNGPVTDPTGPANGTHRVMRGGAWSNGPVSIRVAIRERVSTTDRDIVTGFRCVMEAAPALDKPTVVP